MSSLYRASRLGPANRRAARFISSIESDRYLFDCVIQINQAHITMLARNGIIARKDARKVLQALQRIRSMPNSPGAEDVHVAIEESVINRAGESAGGNLQLAKSRNDQVATAIRMRLRIEVLQIIDLSIDLLAALQKTVRRHSRTVMIGRTHLQPAEPITYGHYLMAFHDALLRDLGRLEECYARVNLSPMGACALAGTSIPIDRTAVAKLLGFDGIVENSLDAVGSRDFALEFLADMTQLAVDISRLAEDFIVYLTPELDQLKLPKDLSFTSSIMPQKRNPDVIELIRAKCAVPAGAFSQAATILHSLPTSYNLDLQEITPKIWAASEAMQEIMVMTHRLVSQTEIRPTKVDKLDLLATTATEIANILVTDLGVPFRLAHQIVASAATGFSEISSKGPGSWRELVSQKVRARLGRRANDFDAALARLRNLEAVLSRKRSVGSPAPSETLRLLDKRAISLRQVVRRQSARRDRVFLAKRQLGREIVGLSR